MFCLGSFGGLGPYLSEMAAGLLLMEPFVGFWSRLCLSKVSQRGWRSGTCSTVVASFSKGRLPLHLARVELGGPGRSPQEVNPGVPQQLATRAGSL